ncbi:hypothetical protein CHLRE_09g386735v5 [Chlamydomonas reinhardtii]|uniref:Acetyltransferase component of pyruvate dehydrogenase complex n=1 Tax=Chlamydomonas reinhardtii TaxID=3055 RepID=A0A2K3DCF4_CHLRE|nr:uncharacterized protein CHLRE_09g386735v5 [Chlamydomonas reinhardtii]PNW78214.1 hypothetical protein CHLRE_09g386735v5 [Chlamydomonas reinhardtii]
MSSGGARRLALRLASRAAQPCSIADAQMYWASHSRLSWLPAVTHARQFASYPAHVVLNMPSLSPTMTQGNITKWHKQPGEQVAPGQILAEVETDKATIEWEAQEEGFMAKHLVPEGARDIAVGTPVAVLSEEADGVAGLASFTPGASSSSGGSAPAAQATEPKAAAAAAAPAKPAATLPPHQVLNMPSLSPTMSRGNIVEWKKKVGDSVAPGDVYCEVETDKATISWESQEEGFIARILLSDGSKDIEVGTPVLVLVEEKETVPAFADFTPGAPQAAAPAAPAPTPAHVPAAPKAAPAAAPRPAAPSAAATASAGGRLRSSPYARKLAAELGVQLQSVAGTGPGGRVVAADVKSAPRGAAAAPSAGAATAAPSAGAAAAAGTEGEYTDIPHSQIRRVVARRLLESKQTVPHYYLTMDCNVEELLALRERMNAQLAGGVKGGAKDGAAPVKLSVNDFIIKSAAQALKAVPGVNSSWQPDYIRQYRNVDISVAVQTPGGLQVPIVRDADLKSLTAISADVRALAAKAKAGKLAPEDYVGGTFTVSNLGMYGIKQFAAIVNPPQAAILAVGASTPTVVRGAGGVFREVPVLAATLSCDHRVIDGAMGAEWLAAFKNYMEAPLLALA